MCLSRAESCGDAVALKDDDGVVTYRELADRAQGVAVELGAVGVRAGDRVMLRGRNRVPWVVAAFGIMLTGAVLVPIGHAESARTRVSMVDRLRPRAIVAEGANGDVTGDMTGDMTGDVAEDAVEEPGGAGELELDRLVRSGSARSSPWNPPSVDPEATAVVLQTSGTSGTPKAVPMTHGSVVRLYSDLSRRLGLRGDDVVSGVVPLAHGFGFFGVLLDAMLAGAAVRLVPQYDRERIADLVADEGITAVIAPPVVFHDLASSRRPDTGARCRIAVTGGADVSLPGFTAACDVLGIGGRFVGYGMTEACGAVAFGDVSGSQTGGAPVVEPLDGIEVRVVDQQGDDRPAGVEGEIWVRGYNVMPSCSHDAATIGAATIGAVDDDAVDDDGWLHTGDVGSLTGDGGLSVVSRLTDTVIVSGFNVHPREVEQVLCEHEDVGQAGVLGVDDDRQGQRLVACVVPRPGVALDVEALTAHCRERLPAFKVPRTMVRVDALPTTETGKLSRARLRELVAARW